MNILIMLLRRVYIISFRLNISFAYNEALEKIYDINSEEGKTCRVLLSYKIDTKIISVV